jgi:hypothetical protein
LNTIPAPCIPFPRPLNCISRCLLSTPITILYIRETMLYTRETIPYIRETIPFIRMTILYMRETIPYIRITILYIRETVVYTRETVVYTRETIPYIRVTMLYPRVSFIYIGHTRPRKNAPTRLCGAASACYSELVCPEPVKGFMVPEFHTVDVPVLPTCSRQGLADLPCCKLSGGGQHVAYADVSQQHTPPDPRSGAVQPALPDPVFRSASCKTLRTEV